MIKPINNISFKAVYVSSNLNEGEKVTAANIFNQLDNSPRDYKNRNYIEQLEKDFGTNVYINKANSPVKDSVSVVLRNKGADINIGEFDRKENPFNLSTVEKMFPFGEDIDKKSPITGISGILLAVIATLGILFGVTKCSADKLSKSAKSAEQVLLKEPVADISTKAKNTLKLH